MRLSTIIAALNAQSPHRVDIQLNKGFVQEAYAQVRRALASIPAIVLAVLLFLLGHDALVAANPHAETSVHSLHAKGALSSLPCYMSGDVYTVFPELPVPQTPFEAIAVFPVVLLHLEQMHIIWEQEPDHPPDVRRALLQVFLN